MPRVGGALSARSRQYQGTAASMSKAAESPRRNGESILAHGFAQGEAIGGPVLMLLALFALSALSAQPAPAPPPFTARCAACHGDDARGTAQAPGLVMNPRVAAQSVEQLRAIWSAEILAPACPPSPTCPPTTCCALARYLRRINSRPSFRRRRRRPHARSWGPPQPGDWRTYNGSDSANRYSPLTQITRDNVASLKLKWVFPMPYFGLEVTPLAADGVLYVTGPNQVVALDAGTGQALWTYSRPPSPGTGRRRAARHQPRRRASRRQGLLRHRQRPPARARSRHRRAAVGNADGARAPPSERRHHYGGTIAPLVVRRHGRSPASPARMRASAVSSRPSTPRPARWCGGAGPCPVAANAASRPGRVRSRSGRRVDLADRLVRPVVRHALLGDRQSLAGRRRPRPSRATTSITNCVLALDADDRRAEVALPVHAARRRRIAMPPSPTCWWTACIAASRRSCCSTPIATASSTCSIGPTAQCCWPSRSSGAWTGPRHRRRWTAGREGSARVSGRRRQLVLDGVLPGNRPVLLPGAGRMRRHSRPATPIKPGSASCVP